MLRSRTSKRTTIVVTVLFSLITAGVLMCIGGFQEWLPFHSEMKRLGVVALLISVITVTAIILAFMLFHGFAKGGVKYSWRHFVMQREIRTQLLNAGVYVEGFYGQEKVAVLPRVKVSFDKGLLTGTVQIQRQLKIDKKLEGADISCALGRYVVEQSYVSADANYYLYDIFDAAYDRQLKYQNCHEYIAATQEAGDYGLMIDAVTTIPLHHTLICGQTGSGKSYFLNALIVQMLNKRVRYHLYFADPKHSGLSVVGRLVDESRTADTIDGIIELLRAFHTELRQRMDAMSVLLSGSARVDRNYNDFGLEPSVLIFDEYLAFSLSLATRKKEVRDEVASILSDVVLMGRQCGFYLWLVMQSAPATQIPTYIRDQMVWKVVLGSSDRSTYTVTFDSSADIPTGKFSVGYGVYTFSGITEKPRILAAPTIRDFDVVKALSITM